MVEEKPHNSGCVPIVELRKSIRTGLILKALFNRFTALKKTLPSVPFMKQIPSQQIIDNAQIDMIRIIQKYTATGNKTDRAIFSSSWCHSGVWIVDGRLEDKTLDGWTGTLLLTTKIMRKTNLGEKLKNVEAKSAKGYKIGKTYQYHNVHMSCWVLMKQAMGWFGTGAGSVFWRTYLRGHRSGSLIPTLGVSQKN